MRAEWLTRTWLRLRALLNRDQLDRDLEDELQFHQARREEKLGSTGVDLQDAHFAAHRSLGNSTSLKEITREMWTFNWAETLWLDIRFGARMLRKNPGFTTVAILTLALGIGANTAIFSVVNAILLRPLPFKDPSRLVTVLETKASQGLDWLFVMPSNYVEWQKRANVFESMAAVHGCDYRMADDNEPRLLSGNCATASFLPMLGVQPIMGRLWSAEEDLPGNDAVAVVSYGLWKRQFGGDPNVIGKAVWRTGDRKVYTIIGVLPPEFQFDNDTAVWTPIGMGPEASNIHFHTLNVFARLKQGVSIEQAQTAMNGIAGQLEREFPRTNTGWGVTVQRLQQFMANLGNTGTTLMVLLAAVGLLLLIACSNVANLLLARATVRQREIAVRVAIGASRFRVVRQLLTESLLLGLIGGGGGFLIAWAAFGPLISIAPRLPSFQPDALRIDAPVFLFSIGVSLLASIFFGLTPAMRISRQDLNITLRESGRGGHGTIRDRAARHALVVSEIGVAVILLVGTGLLIESFRNLQKDPLGFNSDHVLTIPICCLDQAHYSSQQQISSFQRQLLEKIRALPGVEAASSTVTLPLRQFDGSGSPFIIQGRPAPQPGHETLTDSRMVEPDYFHTMGIATARGRVFTPQDDENHVAVAVINETMARRYWPGQDPVGQQIQLVNHMPFGHWFTVIGVAADSKDRGLGRETRCMVYISVLQDMIRGEFLMVRTGPDPRTMAASIRGVVRSVNRDMYTGNSRTLDEALDQSLAPQRFSVTLLTLFAALALCLASIGVYGVTAYSVAQRTQEIGIRIALGAQPRNVVMLLLGQGARLSLTGVIAGTLGALALTRLMTSLLFGVSAHDPFTLLIVCAILICVALLACYIPARRAMRVDPMVALRHD